jgi:hypothetical protein
MPITPKQIRERKGRAVFEFAGESVWVEYAAAPVEGLTKEQVEGWSETMQGFTKEEEAATWVAGILCQYITAWDVVEGLNEDGTYGFMIPLEPERVAALDLTFLARVMVEIVRDANESKLGGTTSRAPSGATS